MFLHWKADTIVVFSPSNFAHVFKGTYTWIHGKSPQRPTHTHQDSVKIAQISVGWLSILVVSVGKRAFTDYLPITFNHSARSFFFFFFLFNLNLFSLLSMFGRFSVVVVVFFFPFPLRIFCSFLFTIIGFIVCIFVTIDMI